ncbi:conserved unknown protein [Ectocarpus siliculosus]|uniref:Peroxisomal membrane protein PEX14 n=1 Tax=Ectocarpus siliculosus TaxID=2880 RepID=D7G592_ECTSI|nr:conserved unknown protein [Ectocarpus siliculosus]|eukprot:CBJ27246.1 conserved unknown protein [Ectocarpus siliculosus]
MREDQIVNGVNFLVHPKAKTAPLSQRISFLENKGLTAEEISAALSRAEGGEDSNGSATAGGNSGLSSTSASSSGSSAFPAEASIPLWRQVAVPGVLAMGAVGALGTYYAASRSEGGGPSQSGASSQAAAAAAGRIPNSAGATEATTYGGVGRSEPRGADAAAENSAYAERAYEQGRLTRSETLEDGMAFLPFDGSEQAPPGTSPGESPLAGEFRRLTETMEQQTGHLVEAVEAMKALASRAEQDSSSLLAARVGSHTSELRAELGTIKQLLLLQAGVEGGGAGTKSMRAISSVGAADAGEASRKATTDQSDMSAGVIGAGGGGEGAGSRSAEGLKGGADEQANGASVSGGLPVRDPEEDMAQEAADKAAAEAAALAATEGRKATARAALAALVADNSAQAAKDGMAMLRMLVANLVNQPNVPRYRRIATSNDNFKKRLLPLEGHRAMMEAVGFKPKGSLWEWTWHEDSTPSASSNNKAVLEDIVKAIDAVARPNGPPLSTASAATVVPPAATVAAPAAASAAAALTPPAPPPATNVTAGWSTRSSGDHGGGGTAVSEANGGARGSSRPSLVSDSGAVGAAGDGDAVKGSDGRPSSRGGGGSAPALGTRNDVLAAAAQVNGVGGDAGGASSRIAQGDEAPSAAEPVAAAAAESRGKGTVGTKENDLVVEAVEATERGAPPASIAEVAAAIQRGDEPPGIRVVEDRLSDSAPSFAVSSRPSPPKPWEVLSSPEDANGDGIEGRVGTGGAHGYRGHGEERSRPQHAVSIGP